MPEKQAVQASVRWGSHGADLYDHSKPLPYDGEREDVLTMRVDSVQIGETGVVAQVVMFHGKESDWLDYILQKVDDKWRVESVFFTTIE